MKTDYWKIARKLAEKKPRKEERQVSEKQQRGITNGNHTESIISKRST